MKFLGQDFQKLEAEQTDRDTDARDRKHYYAASVTKKSLKVVVVNISYMMSAPFTQAGGKDSAKSECHCHLGCKRRRTCLAHAQKNVAHLMCTCYSDYLTKSLDSFRCSSVHY